MKSSVSSLPRAILHKLTGLDPMQSAQTPLCQEVSEKYYIHKTMTKKVALGSTKVRV